MSRNFSSRRLAVATTIFAIVASTIWACAPRNTPNITGDAINPVAYSEWVQIGSTQQWILVRSHDAGNPVLLVIHGGPGSPETAFFRAFNSELEESFTVVHWEQRGAGKTFKRNAKQSSLELSTYVSDLDELIDHLKRELAFEQLVLMGHSWGTAIGFEYATQHPEKIDGLILVAPIADMPTNERLSYEFALKMAEETETLRALQELEEIGPPPHSWKEMLIERKWVGEFGGGATLKHSKLQMAWEILRQSETNVFDLIAYVQGENYSIERLWPEISQLDFTESHVDFDIPIFFLLGRHDHFLLSPLAEAHFDRIVAPHKKLVWFEESAHSPPFDEPDKFQHIMESQIRPVVIRRSDD